MTIEIIDPRVLREIDAHRANIPKDCISEELSREVFWALHQEAANHSGLLEGEGKRSNRRLDKKKRKKLTDSEHRLKSSWEDAVFRFHPLRRLDEGLIIETANNLTGMGYRGYREEDGVRITGSTVQPVRAQKVKTQMDKLIDLVNDGDYHPIEKAGIFHLHMLRVHPFHDGNGRTARMLGNLILYDQGYGPMTIDVGEREFYIGLVDEAKIGYRELESEGLTFEELLELPPSKEEKRFYSYLASKVNTTTQRAIHEIETFPTYTIRLERSSPGQTGSVKNAVASYFRRRNKLGQARIVSPIGAGIIEVRGDAAQVDLERIVGRSYHNKFVIEKD